MRDIHIIKNRLATIEDIYTTLQKNGFFKETETFNYYEILQYLYFMNKLFYDTYLIFKNKKSSREKKIYQLLQLKHPEYKKNIFTIEQAEYILDTYADSVVSIYTILFDTIKESKKKLDNFKLPGDKNSQKGGAGLLSIDYPDKELYSNNPFTGQSAESLANMVDPNKCNNAGEYVKSLYSEDHLKKVQNMLGIKDIGSVINKLETKIGSDEIKKQPDLRGLLIKALRFNLITGPSSIYKTYQYLFDWIFFPIYQLEQLPVYGIFVEYPLDVISLILDEAQLFLGPWAFMIPKIIDGLTYIGSVAPGVGWAVSASKIPLTAMRIPLEYFLNNGTNTIQFFISIARKDVTRAWGKLASVVPMLEEPLNVIHKFLNRSRKIGKHYNKYYGYANKSTHSYRVLSKPFLDNPMIMLDPYRVYKEVIEPNHNIVPVLKDMPSELKWATYKLYELFKLTQPKLSKQMKENLLKEKQNVPKQAYKKTVKRNIYGKEDGSAKDEEEWAKDGDFFYYDG